MGRLPSASARACQFQVAADKVARGCSNHMLKLDTQGYDRQVFHGSHSCLDKFCVLQSELSFISVYEGIPDAYEVLEEYHKQGFFISGIYPINRDASLALIESDCVLVKRTTA
jgi:hypothetical protein